MRGWFALPRRATEATPEQVVATGAAGSSYGGVDPVDGDTGWRRAGYSAREVPYWTREKSRVYAVASYRSNPMCQAVVDTMVAFAVGASGVKPLCTNPEVSRVVDEFWTDPANRLGQVQEVNLRSQILLGEQLYELMVGSQSGAVRYSPIDPEVIRDITLRHRNPMWPDEVVLPPVGASSDEHRLKIVHVDDDTGLRAGNGIYWAPWRTLNTDVRGMPLIMSILDWLDNYDQVLSNLIDRTALARYLVWDVTVTGSQKDVDDFVQARGGLHVPPSGSVEVHNESVKWEAKSAPSGAAEDTQAAASVLTNIAGGAGLSKVWLADPEGANRATSLSMAEPVRRRVGAVQKVWLDQQTEFCRFAVDQAVAAKRLPATVEATDPRTGEVFEIPASQSVIVTGPEIAAADAQITAQVLLNLSTGLEKLVQIGALSPEAARLAARKAWEDYVGVPYRAELDSAEANPDDVATAVDEAATVHVLRALPR